MASVMVCISAQHDASHHSSVTLYSDRANGDWVLRYGLQPPSLDATTRR